MPKKIGLAALGLLIALGVGAGTLVPGLCRPSFETLLDKTDFDTRLAFSPDRNNTASSYGLNLLRLLDGDLEALPKLAFWGERSGLLLGTFIPQWPISDWETQPQKYAMEKDFTRTKLEAFWKKWLVRLYGSEGAYYRECAKYWGARWLTPLLWFSQGRYWYHQYPNTDDLVNRAASMGDPEALYLYGMARFRDPEVAELVDNPEEGWQALLRSAELGYPPAQLEVGTSYATGFYVPEDLEKARPYLEKALENGCLIAAQSLAFFYLEPDAPVPDPEKATYYMFVAAQDPFTTAAIAEGLSPEKIEELGQQARQTRERCKAVVEQRQADLLARWMAMVPEVKKDIYKEIPWFVWTAAPRSLYEKYNKPGVHVPGCEKLPVFKSGEGS